jgi:hypothetical protein
MTDEEIADLIYDAIDAYCEADIRDAVLSRFQHWRAVVAATDRLGLFKLAPETE